MTESTFRGVIMRPSTISPVTRGGGITTRPLVGPRIGNASFLSGITEFPPSAALNVHTHNCEESVMILEGTAEVEVDGVRTPLEVSNVTWVPANVPHRFINTSDDAPMRIFWTYASAEATRTNPETGETHTILSEHEVVAP